MNTQAFRLGRQVVADPNNMPEFAQETSAAVSSQKRLTRAAQALIDATGANGELRRLLEIRVPQLIAYQNGAYARRYVDFVARVRQAEQAAMPRPDTPRRGGGALPVQADGLQGRV